MSRTSKTAAVLAAFAGLLAAGTASAATLNHHAAPAARTTVAQDDDAAAAPRPAVESGSATVGAPGRGCTRGHLSHGHC